MKRVSRLRHFHKSHHQCATGVRPPQTRSGSPWQMLGNLGLGPMASTGSALVAWFHGLTQRTFRTSAKAVATRPNHNVGRFEQLEDRRLLTTSVELVVGDLVITDETAGGNDDDLTISISSGNIVINDPTVPLTTTIPTATQPDANTVEVPLADITGGDILVNTLAGDDTVTVNDAIAAPSLSINAGADNDTIVLADGVGVSGIVDGGSGSDTLDYSAYATEVAVDLSSGLAENIDGNLATGGTGSSIENVLGGLVDDTLTGDLDDNTLGDGPGVDLLSGGPGDDTFLLTLGAATEALPDQVSEAAGNDTFDFSPFDDGSGNGIAIDLDLVGMAQEVAPGHWLLMNPQPGETAADDSPYENFVGSTFDDELHIDPLPVIRTADGNDGTDLLHFDGGGSVVTDTSIALTAAGIGTVMYANFELIEPTSSAPQVIDNDDLGFSHEGPWGRSRVEGYRGDERFLAGGDGSNIARYTFGGVVPGWYRVSATWVPGANRAEDAQFRVLDGATVVGPGVELINQRTRPRDFESDGALWQDLVQTDGSGAFLIGTHTLVVEVLDGGNAFVFADAVRIEPITAMEAEIRITEGAGGTEMIDGRSLSDFGLTFTGDPVSKDFIVTNIGIADLTIDTPTVPTGYSVVLSDPGPLAAGDSVTMTVTLDATDPGTISGDLVLGNSDRDENPFSIRLVGLVRANVPVVPGDVRVIDNDNFADPPTFRVIGDGFDLFSARAFQYQLRDTRYVNNDYRFSNQGTGENLVQWVFRDLAPEAEYTISATWVGGELRATNAPFRAFTEYSGEELLAVEVDQNVQPLDFQEGGILWQMLGSVTLPAGQTTLVVELSDNANGYVLADAIRIESQASVVSGEVGVFDGDTELFDGASLVDFGYSEPMPTAPTTKAFEVTNTTGAVLTLTEPIRVPLGFSLVHSFQDIIGNAKTELAQNESAYFEVAVDAAAPGEVTGEISFENSDPNRSPFQFTVTSQVGVQIVDNDDDAAFSQTGFGLFEDPRYYGSDFRYHGSGDGTDTAQWQFDGLTGGKYYAVAATWVTGLSRASDAPFRVLDATGAELIAVPVDQSVPPDDFNDGGSLWEQFAVVQVPAGQSSLTVELSDGGNDFVYADAVRMEQLYLPVISVDVGGLVIESGDTIDWTTVMLGAPNQKIVTVTNQGVLPLVISDSLVDLVGFEVNGLTTPTVLATGETLPFTIDLITDPNVATPGDYGGSITLDNGDINANPFIFYISGSITDSRIVDNDDLGFELNLTNPRAFKFEAGDTRYYLNDYRYQGSGIGDNEVSWTFSDVPAGEFTIAATWVGGPNRATNSPFAVFDGSGNELLTVEVDQSVSPLDFQDEGSWWDNLGRVTLAAGEDTLVVKLTDAANGIVLADAVQIVQPFYPEIELTVDGEKVRTGDTIDFGTLLEDVTAEKTITISNAGLIDLDITPIYTGATAFTIDPLAPATIVGGASIDVTVTLDTSASGVFFGEYRIGSNDANENPYVLHLQGRVTDQQVSTIRDPGLAVITGDAFSLLVRDLSVFGGSYIYAPAGDGDNTVQLLIPGLTPRDYEVWTTWTPGPAAATDAPFTVLAAASTDPADLAAATVVTAEQLIDQTVAPSTDEGGVLWQPLGLATLGAGQTTLIVQLTDNADGVVIANAVRITLPTPLKASDAGAGSADSLRVDTIDPALDTAVDLWAATGLSQAEISRLQNVDVQVADLSGNTLGLASWRSDTIWLDANAAGHGWSLVEGRGTRDESQVPGVDGTDTNHSGPGPWTRDSRPRMDLLSVLSHELGHLLGYEHDQGLDVMAAELGVGLRWVTTSGTDGFFEKGLGVREEEVSRESRLIVGAVPFQLPTIQTSFFAPLSDSPLAGEETGVARLTATDALFAGLDDADLVAHLENVGYDGTQIDPEEETDEAEDGLDLWSLLYGLR